MANIRRLFAGTNSAGGFVSFFAHITNQGTKMSICLRVVLGRANPALCRIWQKPLS